VAGRAGPARGRAPRHRGAAPALDRLGDHLKVVERDLARAALIDKRVRHPMTIPGIDMVVTLALMAAVGDIERFDRRGSWSVSRAQPQAYGIRSRARPTMGGSPSRVAATPAACWSRQRGWRRERQVLCAPYSSGSAPGAGSRKLLSGWRMATAAATQNARRRRALPNFESFVWSRNWPDCGSPGQAAEL
jgi:hypothetical protein